MTMDPLKAKMQVDKSVEPSWTTNGAEAYFQGESIELIHKP